MKKRYKRYISYNNYIHYSNIEPKNGEIWLAKAQYLEKGNWYKIRPVLIIENQENEITYKIITGTKRKDSKEIIIKGSYKKSYLLDKIRKAKKCMFIRRIMPQEMVRSYNDGFSK